MRSKEKKQISSEKVVVTSFIVDISDVLINLFVAIISGSAVMESQALEGAADLVASGLLLVGVTRSKKPFDRRHPYGYGRELYFWTFLSALVTFLITSTLSLYLGFDRVIHPEKISNMGLSLAVLFLAILTNGYSMSLSYKRLLRSRPGVKIWKVLAYPALIETKTVFVQDLMGTGASVLGLVALLLYILTGDMRYDGIGAVAIGLTLALLAFYVVKAAKDLLVGQAASSEIEEKIEKITESVENVNEVIDLRTLYIGPKRLLVNMEIHAADGLTTDDIEKLIDEIEHEIKKEVPAAVSIQVELETPDIYDEYYI